MSASLTRLQVFHFRHRLDRPIPTTMGLMTGRPALLLRIEDAEGASGWGEVWCNFPPDGDLHRARLAANVLPAALTGLTGNLDKKPFEVVQTRLHRLAIQAGEPGPVAQLAAGVDIALHDLAARRADVPLAVLLGGQARHVPAYASGISPAVFQDQFARMRSLGYRRFKQRIGFGPDDGLGEVETAASGLAPYEKLMVDANQAWDLPTALQRAERLAPLGVGWLEEPLPADAPDADWHALAKATDIPLAGGENLRGDDAFYAAIDLGALSVLQPDICKWGGLSGCFAVASRARERGLIYCPHFLGGGVGLMASAHMLSAVGGPGLLEVDSSENPLLDLFSGRGLSLSDGLFPLIGGPGLGYDPDISAAADMLVSEQELRLEA